MSTEFSADEVGLQFTWAWGLSPLSAKCLPASPQVVRNLFPYGKGLSHNFVAWLRDIHICPLHWLQVSEYQTLWGYGDSTCSSLSLYRYKCNSKILTANEDPLVRSPHSRRLKWVLDILIVKPWIPFGTTKPNVMVTSTGDWAPGICIVNKLSHFLHIGVWVPLV